MCAGRRDQAARGERLEHVGKEHAAADRWHQHRAGARRCACARRVASPVTTRGRCDDPDTGFALGGRSRLYAEITRIRALADIAAGPVPLLFLLGELFHGTNSSDRLLGGKGVLSHLLDRGARGLITTHDLALAAMADDDLAPRAVIVHFQDGFDEGAITFDYWMQARPVTRSNALALMRGAGLEVVNPTSLR
jgi:hypothetical protein